MSKRLGHGKMYDLEKLIEWFFLGRLVVYEMQKIIYKTKTKVVRIKSGFSFQKEALEDMIKSMLKLSQHIIWHYSQGVSAHVVPEV